MMIGCKQPNIPDTMAENSRRIEPEHKIRARIVEKIRRVLSDFIKIIMHAST